MNSGFSVDELRLCQLLAATSLVTPTPVKQDVLRRTDMLDITLVFKSLKPDEVKQLTRNFVKIEGMDKLRQLVMHVLRRELPQYCPFLTHVIDTFEGEEALSMAQLVVNQGSNEHLEIIIGSSGLSAKKLASIIEADCRAVRKDVITAVHDLWEAESKLYAEKNPAAARESVKNLPSYKKLENLRAAELPTEKHWLDEESRLMLQNNDDLARLRKDWPEQRAWLQGHLQSIGKKTRLEDVVALAVQLEQELTKIENYPKQHIRYAHPAWNRADIELLRLIVREVGTAGKVLPSKVCDEVKAILARCIARHDELVLFPKEESGNVIKASSDELARLREAVKKLESTGKCNERERLRIVGDIDMCNFRCRLLLALSTKHLQHNLFDKGVGLLSQRLLPRLQACPNMAKKLSPLLENQVLDESGQRLYKHCVWLRKECDKIVEQLDALLASLAN